MKNRICCIALKAYLGDEPEPREPVGAEKLVPSLAELGLDADEISEATDLDRERVVAVQEAGQPPLHKVWLTGQGAKHPRHEDYPGLDGQTQPLNGVFSVGEFSLAYPGDPNGPASECANCRCALAYVEAA